MLTRLILGENPRLPVWSELGILGLRVFTGLSLALAHGIRKIPPPEGFVETVASLGFPLPGLFAWAAALSEFAGGILLGLGLLTRPSALFAAFTMAVAAFGRHGEDPFQQKELALLYGCIAGMYALLGATQFSLDEVLRKRLVGKPLR